jgi:hypothetical protein
MYVQLIAFARMRAQIRTYMRTFTSPMHTLLVMTYKADALLMYIC